MPGLILILTLINFVLPAEIQADRAAVAPPTASQSIEAIFNRAAELQRQGKWKEAAESYRVFLEQEPNHAGAHANLGAVLSHLGLYQEAIDNYETALRLNPQLTLILFNLGAAHFRAGQFLKATETLRRFLAANPNASQAQQLFGLALVELGRDEEALQSLEPALTANPNDPSLLFGLGLAYLRLNRPEVRPMIERLASVPQGLALAHLLRGQNFLADNEIRSATEALESAAKLSTDLPRLHFSLGTSYLRAGRNPEAITEFKKELQRQPRDFWSLYYLAFLLEAGGMLDQARERLEIALRVEARSPEANALLGKILLKQGNASDAVGPLEIAVAENPKDSNIRFQLARAYQQSGRRKEAAREFTEVERLKNQDLEKERKGLSKPQ